MKTYKLILILSLCIFLSCSEKKKVQILGYGYENENILVLENKKVLLDLKIRGNKDSNQLCSFYEEKLKIPDSNNTLVFKIDSSGTIILDTTLTIPKKFKKPFVSFIYPTSKSNFKRKIFLDDDNNNYTE